MSFMKFYVDFIRFKQAIEKDKNNIIRYLRLKIREGFRKNWNIYEGFHEL